MIFVKLRLAFRRSSFARSNREMLSLYNTFWIMESIETDTIQINPKAVIIIRVLHEIDYHSQGV